MREKEGFFLETQGLSVLNFIYSEDNLICDLLGEIFPENLPA